MIKIVTEPKKQDVGFIVDVDPEWVSMVRHGANQQPFRVIKNAEGGEPVKVIQSIFTPAGADIQKLVTEKGLEYLSEANLENVAKSAEYCRYDQIPITDVENFQMLKAGEGWLVVGTLKEGKSADNLLAVSDEQFSKLEKLPIPEAFADDQWMVDYGPTFMDGISREVYALMDVIGGTLRQAGVKSPARRKTIFQAIDSFKSFMGIALDALGEGMAKTDVIDTIMKHITEEEGGEDMLFKDKDEFIKETNDLITAALTAHTETLMAKIAEKFPAPATVVNTVVEPPVAPVVKTDDPFAGIMAAVAEIKAEMTDLKTKMDDQLGTEPAAIVEPDNAQTPEPDKGNVWGGFLTKKV